MTDKCQWCKFLRLVALDGQLKQTMCFLKAGSSCSVSLDELPQGGAQNLCSPAPACLIQSCLVIPVQPLLFVT